MSANKIAVIKVALKKWLKPLGLLWWEINAFYYDDPASVLDIFGSAEENRQVFARTTVDWRYGLATIQFNLLIAGMMSDGQIEKGVLHELCHILVNEMREGELHHEERVVTQLQKAFTWTAQMDKPK